LGAASRLYAFSGYPTLT